VLEAILLPMILGGVALIAGAEGLVRGASRIAAAAGISPLVIGLTVVALGTSAPEFAVSIQAATSGRPDLAFGNVVGSNILNILLVLGVSAVIIPLVVARQLVRLDVPLMIGASAALLLFSLDGRVSRLEGVVLASSLAGYLLFLVVQTRRDRAAEDPAAATSPLGARGWTLSLTFVVGGLALLVVGARFLVDGASSLARSAGLSELVVGLTVVAVGTSLPEIATSIIAAARGERDIAVGNVVGSNLFNILGVLGLAAAIAPAGMPVARAALGFDLPVMMAVAVATLPIFFTGYMIARWEGWLFLAYYAAYTGYLLLDSADHDALPLFSGMMLLFVLPVTAVTLAVLFAREIRAKWQRRAGTGQIDP
jgi:cation:H+ antiporter